MRNLSIFFGRTAQLDERSIAHSLGHIRGKTHGSLFLLLWVGKCQWAVGRAVSPTVERKSTAVASALGCELACNPTRKSTSEMIDSGA